MPDRRADIRTTLSLLWLFAILNTLFRDIHEMTMASTIAEISSGYLNGNPVTEGVLLAGAFAVELVLFAFLLSALLPPRFARGLNLVLPPLAVSGVFLGVPNDPDDIFFASVTITTFTVIFWLAWRWAPGADTGVTSGVTHGL